MRLRLIPRYVFREILPPTLLGLSTYTAVLLMNRIFQLVDLAIRKDIPALTVVKLVLFSLPRLFALTIPMAVLLGVLVGIARLSADSEIVAMRACGVSRSAFIFPVLFLAAPAALFCAADMIWMEPRANYAAHQLYSRSIRETEAATRIHPGVFYDAIPNTVLHASGTLPDSNLLEKLILYRRVEDRVEELTLAGRGVIRYHAQEDRLQVNLEECITHLMPEGRPEDHRVLKAGSRQVLLPPDPSLRARLGALHRGVPKNYAELSLRELSGKLREASRLTHPLAARRVQGTIRAVLHEKFAIPVACVVFGLFSLGLGLRARRSGRTSGFAVSMGVILGYWAIYTMGRGLATRGILPAWIGLWTGNLLFLVLALFLLRRQDVPRTRVPRRPPLPRGERTDSRSLPASQLPRRTYRRRGVLSLLDRHVLTSFLRAFLLVLLSLYAVFVLVEFRDLIDEAIEHGQPMSLLVLFFLFRLPWTVQQILPMAALIGCVVSLGLMTRHHEVAAFQAAGVSLFRIAAPVILVTLGICGFSYLLQDHALPVSNREANLIKNRIRGREATNNPYPRTNWILVKQRDLVHFRNYRQGVEEFQGLSIYRIDPVMFRLESRTFAERGRWRNGRWLLRQGWVRSFPESEESTLEKFSERQVPAPDFPAELFASGAPFPFSLLPHAAKTTSEQMAFGELLGLIRQLRQSHYEVRELLVALHSKLSFPLIPFVMVLLGVPSAFRSGRRGTLYGLGISLLLVLVYYGCFAVLTALGNAGYLPPFLGAWGPNLLFTAGAVYLLARLRS